MFVKFTPPTTIYMVDLEHININNTDTFVDGSIGFFVYGRAVK